MDDAAVVAVIEKMLKQRRDSITQYEAAKREDLANVEKYEISVLRAYLPLAFSDSKIERLVDEIIASIEAKGQQELGKVIAVLKPKLAGRADMGKVVALVRTKLTS